MENKSPRRIKYKGQIYEAVEDNFGLTKIQRYLAQEREKELQKQANKNAGVTNTGSSRADIIQLRKNIRDILGIHQNDVYDGYEEDFVNDDEIVEYVKDRVFDQKTISDGHTKYADGICKNLKFLGDKVIADNILKIYHSGDF